MRQVLSLNQNWYFSKGEEIPANASEAAENGWRKVEIPHTYNAFDGQDGGGDYYRGKAVYIREIQRPEVPADARIYIEWEGVNSIAEVFVNGNKKKEHRGGYSAFRVDVTGGIESRQSGFGGFGG